MKQQIIILFILFFTTSLLAQKGNPILSYNENGYTKDEVKNFALSNNEITAGWRAFTLETVNKSLTNQNYSLRVNENHIGWVIDSVRYEYVELDTFVNTRELNGNFSEYPDGGFKGGAAVFYYKNVRVVLYKTICVNAIRDLSPKLKIVQVVPEKITQTVPPGITEEASTPEASSIPESGTDHDDYFFDPDPVDDGGSEKIPVSSSRDAKSDYMSQRWHETYARIEMGEFDNSLYLAEQESKDRVALKRQKVSNETAYQRQKEDYDHYEDLKDLYGDDKTSYASKSSGYDNQTYTPQQQVVYVQSNTPSYYTTGYTTRSYVPTYYDRPQRGNFWGSVVGSTIGTLISNQGTYYRGRKYRRHSYTLKGCY